MIDLLDVLRDSLMNIQPEWLTAIGTSLTPIAVLYIGQQLMRRRTREAQLHHHRAKLFRDIVQPFTILFSSAATIEYIDYDGPATTHEEIKHDLFKQRVHSLEYREASFMLQLIGTDEVVRTYNELMQLAFAMNESDDVRRARGYEEPINSMRQLDQFASLLLAMRRGYGNDDTECHRYDLLEFLMTDIRRIQTQGVYPESLEGLLTS